jgi:hypothetical protein
MNIKKILESRGLIEGVDFTITPEGFSKVAKTRMVDQEIVHPAIPAVMNGETVIEQAIASYTETIQVEETYFAVFPSNEEIVEMNKNLEIEAVDIALLIEAFLADKQSLRDVENDSINIVDNRIHTWNFANIPQPTRDELHALVAPSKAKQTQDEINAASLKHLADTDYLIIRELDSGVACPIEIKNSRAAARAAIVR